MQTRPAGQHQSPLRGGASGQIDVSGAIDLLSINTYKDEEYTLVAKHHNSAMDVVLTFYATDRTTVLSEDKALGQKMATIEWTAPASGSPYFRIYRAADHNVPGYT